MQATGDRSMNTEPPQTIPHILSMLLEVNLPVLNIKNIDIATSIKRLFYIPIALAI
jgi:hypothetical protein